jgi:hypothetical protein
MTRNTRQEDRELRYTELGVAIKLSEWFYCKPHTCILNSLLWGVTFEVLPLSRYAFSPTMLPLLEIFFELLLWNSFQCRRHIFWMSSVSWNLHSFKAGFIFRNSQKSFGVKSGQESGCYISVIEFWVRNFLKESTLWGGDWYDGESNRWVGQSSGLFLHAQLHITASVFPHNKLSWHFVLLELIEPEQYFLIPNKMMSIVFICHFQVRVFLSRRVGGLHWKIYRFLRE